MRTAHWRSAGLVVWRRDGPLFYWLMVDSKLRRARPAWEFPKGLIEPGEEPHAAAIRECWEETGILVEPIQLVPGFHERLEWTMIRGSRIIHRTVDYYLAQTRERVTRPNREVREVRWFTATAALAALYFPNAIALLRKAVARARDPSLSDRVEPATA